MKNSIYILTFLFVTIISFSQTNTNPTDSYKNQSFAEKSQKSNIYESSINYGNNVELKVASKKITKNEIEVVFEFVDKPQRSYRGGCVFECDRKNYSKYYSNVGSVNHYTGTYVTKPADTYVPTNTYYNSTQKYTGSRGGQYDIISNGNRTYICR